MGSDACKVFSLTFYFFFFILKLFLYECLKIFLSPLSFLHPSLYPFSEHSLGSLLLTKIKFPKLNSSHLTGEYCMNRTSSYICEPKEWRVIVSKRHHSEKEEWKRGWWCGGGRMLTLWSEPRFWGTRTWTVTLGVWPWASYILSVSHNFIIFKMNMVASSS